MRFIGEALHRHHHYTGLQHNVVYHNCNRVLVQLPTAGDGTKKIILLLVTLLKEVK